MLLQLLTRCLNLGTAASSACNTDNPPACVMNMHVLHVFHAWLHQMPYCAWHRSFPTPITVGLIRATRDARSAGAVGTTPNDLHRKLKHSASPYEATVMLSD